MNASLAPFALDASAKPFAPADDELLDREQMAQGMPDMGEGETPMEQEGDSGTDTRLADAPSDFSVRKANEAKLAQLLQWADITQNINIAAELDQSLLSQIGQRVYDEMEIDQTSRADWLRDTKAAMDMVMQRKKEKTRPWRGASNVHYPLIMQAGTQFAARAYPAIVQNRSVVKTTVVGDDSGTPKTDPNGQPVIDPNTQKPVWADGLEPGGKAARGIRVAQHMSYQLLEEMPEWDDETDTLLSVLSIVGTEFRKTYRDFGANRNVSIRLPAEKVIVNYWARNLKVAPRITEEFSLYPYEIRERVADGRFIAGAFMSPADAGNDTQAPHKFYEQHRRLDLDGDGYEEPYIVTIHGDTRLVTRIVANFEPDAIKLTSENVVSRIDSIDYYTMYKFLPNIEGGIYGHGWAHYLLSTNEAINTTLNMLFDAGHQQVAGNGFIGKGLSLHAGDLSFRPGEYKMVNAPGSTVRENVVPLDHKGPNAALITLLTMLIDSGKDISAIKDVLTGELKAQTMSPTVFTALVEQGLKVFTSIYKRIFRALKSELEKLYRLNRLYMSEKQTYTQGDRTNTVSRKDYADGNGIEPVADPGMVVDAQKLARAEVLGQFKDDPMLDGLMIRKTMLEAANIENPEKYFQGDPAPNPDMILKAGQLEVQRMLAKATMIEKIANAVKAMAEADEE